MKNVRPDAILNEILGYIVSFTLAAGAAYAAKHGWHIHVPVLASSLSLTGAVAFARLTLKGLVKAWHSGKLEAQILADVKRVLASAPKA